MTPPLVDTVIEEPRWEGIDLPGLAERAARETLHDQDIDPQGWEISLLGCDDARIAALNGDFRGKAQPTNVLSWPAQDLAAEDDGAEPWFPAPAVAGMADGLGDIAISYDTCLREAGASGRRLEHHVTHLLVHGVLHLLGYDHIRDGDAARMEETEVRILARMGIVNPYEQ